MSEESIGNIFDAINNADDKSNDFEKFKNATIEEIEVESKSEESSEEQLQNDLDSVSFENNQSSGHSRLQDAIQTPPSNNFTTEGGGEEQKKEFDNSTVEKEETTVEKFDKIKAEAAYDILGDKSKPPVLNKTKILIAIVIVVVGAIIFATFIYPIITERKQKSRYSKPIAEQTEAVDYSLYAKNSTKPTPPPAPKESKTSDGQKDVEIERDKDGIPVVPKLNNNQSRQTNTNNAPSGKERPDTSEDALQSKTINGIKGLTSTQRNYLTPDGTQNNYNNYNNNGSKNNSSSRVNTFGSNGLASSSNDASNPYAKFGLPADRNQYASSLLQQANAANNSYLQQNNQSGKQSFYNNGRTDNVTGQWLAPNTIWQGTIIDATLLSAINTDQPGECIAVVTKNVYSSQNGEFLLIPQNSKLYGSYNSDISYAQSRTQVGWHTLVRPDGYSINLGNMNTTDTRGASGLEGKVNDHPFQYLKALALISAFNLVTTELDSTAKNTNNEYVQNLTANTQNMVNQFGNKLIERAMDIQPTLTVPEGRAINIVANTNLTLPPFELFEVTQPYQKKTYWQR